MQKEERLLIRVSGKLKAKIKRAAWVQGMDMSEYVRDRIEQHLDADISDLRKVLEEIEEEEESLAVAA